MSSFRTGDLVTITGQVMKVEGDFLMIALDGALDAAVPAMVSRKGAKLVRASIHDGDEVEGGFRVHSSIPNTPLVLLQLIEGNPNDPKSFSTAVRDTLTLVAKPGAQDEAAPSTTVEKPQAPTTPAPALAEAAPAPAPAAPTSTTDGAAADGASVTTDSAATGSTQATETAAAPNADMTSRTDAPLADRFGSIAGHALRASQGGSIADLGTVREEASPLKPAGDELLLNEPIDDDKH